MTFSFTLSKARMNFVVEAKNKGPFTLYTFISCVTVTREILATKNSALKMTPTTTPIAKLLVYKIIATVMIITNASDFGACFKNLKELQLKVVILTIIITPTKTGMGISTTTSPKTIIKNIKNTPAVKVDRRCRPPDLMLIMDWPIKAHPAIPPKNPVIKLAIPCPRASLFLLLVVSVISSSNEAVRSDSSRPTNDKAREYGKTIRNVSKLSGISGNKNVGNVLGIDPNSPMVCNLTPLKSAIIVITTMAMSGAGIALKNRGITYTNINVIIAKIYVILFEPIK